MTQKLEMIHDWDPFRLIVIKLPHAERVINLQHLFYNPSDFPQQHTHIQSYQKMHC